MALPLETDTVYGHAAPSAVQLIHECYNEAPNPARIEQCVDQMVAQVGADSAQLGSGIGAIYADITVEGRVERRYASGHWAPQLNSDSGAHMDFLSARHQLLEYRDALQEQERVDAWGGLTEEGFARAKEQDRAQQEVMLARLSAARAMWHLPEPSLPAGQSPRKAHRTASHCVQ